MTTTESSFLEPPFRSGLVSMVATISLGAAIGIGLFAFAYGEGGAYLSNDPDACVNCHVMNEAFDSWVKSSHHAVAVCNDCHLPPGAIGKWLTKADNGLFHSIAFTTGAYPRPIRIKARNLRVAQDACIHCHRALLHPQLSGPRSETPVCTHCHSDPGHALH